MRYGAGRCPRCNAELRVDSTGRCLFCEAWLGGGSDPGTRRSLLSRLPGMGAAGRLRGGGDSYGGVGSGPYRMACLGAGGFAAVVVVLAVVLASCAGGRTASSHPATPGKGTPSDITTASVPEIVAEVDAAVERAGTVTINGAGLRGETQVTVLGYMDERNRSMQMTLTVGSGTLSIAVIGNMLYTMSDRAYAVATNISAQDAGVCASGPASDASHVGVPLAAPGHVFPDVNLSKRPLRIINGIEVLPLVDAEHREWDIATHGEPLPVMATAQPTDPSSTAMTFSFTHWGEPVTISRPAGC